MRLRFTKMHGAGNDFVVLDGTRAAIDLSVAQVQRLGDRRFGVGADQVLVVERSDTPNVDFRYRIYNGFSGDEVEHCGNGARCFLRYVHEHEMTTKQRVTVETVNKLLELQLQSDGRVTVDMNTPVFEHDALPFDASGLVAQGEGDFERWPVRLHDGRGDDLVAALAVLSMGNPHGVLRVDDVDAFDVARFGPLIATHARFARQVNAGFVQVMARDRVKLRVHERGAGETLACGTGACAAVVAGIRLGWLAHAVEVQTRGGQLRIEWLGGDAHVLMTGPAVTVFEGEIEL